MKIIEDALKTRSNNVIEACLVILRFNLSRLVESHVNPIQLGFTRNDSSYSGSDLKSLHSNLQNIMQNQQLSRKVRFAAAEVLEVGFTLLYPSPRSRSSFLSELIRVHVDKPMDSSDANLHLLRRLLLMFSSSDGVVSLLPTSSSSTTTRSSNNEDDVVDLIRLLFEIAPRDDAAIALLRTYQRILISQVSDNRKDTASRLALINYAKCLFSSCDDVLQHAQKEFKIEHAKSPVMTLLPPFALSLMLLKNSSLAESLMNSVSSLVKTLSKCAMFPSVRDSVREFEIVQARRRLLRHKFLDSSNSGFVFSDRNSSLKNMFTRSYVGERDDWSGQIGFEFSVRFVFVIF